MFVSMRGTMRGAAAGRRPRRGHSGARMAALLGVLAGPAPAVEAQFGDPILLNEVLADPARDWNQDGTVNSRDDEWVEIVNTGAATVNLEGYRIASADTVWRYEFSGLLFPGETRVVYGRESYLWELANGFPQFGLRLSNTGGAITLWNVSAGDSVLVDTMSYADHEAEDDRSSGRVPDGGVEWRLFDGLNPYTGSRLPTGTGCLPSPGTLFQCPVPVRKGTWGGIKSRFRSSLL